MLTGYKLASNEFIKRFIEDQLTRCFNLGLLNLSDLDQLTGYMD